MTTGAHLLFDDPAVLSTWRGGVGAPRMEAEMARRRQSRDLARATRRLMKHRPGRTYTQCRQELLDWLDGTDYDPHEAVDYLTDPAYEPLCEVCGWVKGEVCPECGGCGCNAGCTGRRHVEYSAWVRSETGDDEDGGFCPECGGTIETCPEDCEGWMVWLSRVR